MRKLLKLLGIASIFVAVLGFGFVACDNGSGGGSSSGGFESKTKTVAPTELAEKMGIAMADLQSVRTGDITASTAGIVDYEVTEEGLKLTSKKAGTTVLSCDINGESKKIKVTVAKDGTISVAEYKEGEDDKKPDVTADKYTYHWKFTNVTDASKTDVNQELSAEEVTPEGAYDLKLSLNGYFNSISKTQTVGQSSQTAIYGTATVGAVEVGGDTSEVVAGNKGLVSLELKGPFKATMHVCANSSKDKEDRYARIMVGDTEFCNESEKTANKLPTAGTTVVAEYEGTDRVLVKFGGTSITRIYDIIVETTANQNPGAFNASTNSDTANDEATLGIVGTAVSSSDEAVATAKIEDGKIAITSVAKGSATITVSADGSKNTATIPVIVDATGAITLGTIVKNTFAGGTHTFTAEEKALIKLSTDISGITSSDEDVVTVASDLSSITAVAPGTATLTITDGTYNATLPVTVSATGEISLGTVVNPFILDTANKTLDVTSCGLTTISSATMEAGKGTASISEKTLTYAVTGFTAAGTAKITLSDGTNEAEVTVTVDELGAVSAAITKKYVDPNAAPEWYLGTVDKNKKTSTTSATDTATFTSKSVTLDGGKMIVLSDVTAASGKKVILTFDVPAATFSSDAGSGNVYGGLMESDGKGDSTTYAVYVSSKGVSNGSKNMQNGGSSNGFGTTGLSKVKVENVDTAVELKEGTFVTYKLEYTVGAVGGSDGKSIVLTGSVTGTVKDATETTTDKKECKGNDIKWNGSSSTKTSPDDLPLIPFIGNVGTDAVTISNITLTIDDTAVATTANK